MTTPPIDYSRLALPLGDAIFTQRSIRKFRPDPIPIGDVRLIMEAAMRAPNGGNHQIARFLVVNDRETIKRFGALYREAWWAKRKDEKRPWTSQADIPPEEKNYRAASQLAEEMKDAPCVIFAFGLPPGSANSIIPAVQNLMLAARALGIGSLPTTLHASVMGRFNEMFGVPADATFHFCIPLGYPRGSFGPNVRKPTAETTFLGRWGGKVPWA